MRRELQHEPAAHAEADRADLGRRDGIGGEQIVDGSAEIAVDRAQTVLRYWNWALSSAMTPALIKAIREENDAALDEFSVPQRSAKLAFSSELKR